MTRRVLRSCCACLLFVQAFLLIGPAAAQDGVINEVLMADFITTPGAPKKLIIRAAGPTANNAAPNLELFSFWYGVMASSANWTSADDTLLAMLPAFTRPASAHQTALSATINSAGYTAILSNMNTSQDLAIIEVYDVSGAPVLLHSSTRGAIQTPGASLTASFSLSPSAGPRRLLIRAIGPGLATLGVPNTLSDPDLTVVNATQQTVATNEDWTSDQGWIMAQVGAFMLPGGSRDAAVIMDFQPDSYTVRVGSKTGSGSVLVEVYDLGPGQVVSGGALSVRANVGSTASTHSAPAEFVFSRTGNLDQALTVTYALSGSAQAGTDYSGLTGSVIIPAGMANVSAFVTALPQGGTDGSKTVMVTVAPQSGYTVAAGSAQVELFFGAGTLFLANLRPPATVPNSAAFGTSTVQLSADERFLDINLSFSGLSSAETVSYLRLNSGGEDGASLVRLPVGGTSSRLWQIVPSGGFSAADIVAALKAGKLFVSVGSENFPAGELRGIFLASSGPQDPNPPPDPGTPPPVVTPAAAARFLIQATFGPRKADIDQLLGSSYNSWITDQMALTPSLHKDAAQADFDAFNTTTTLTRPGGSNRQAAWWKIAVTGSDQLRQRVAFALSEIFVISDVNGTVANWEDGAANYYDLLARDAFGNFRALLEDVTLSPMMGVYLSHIRNSKATATTQPDENYAREVMQLFTIGLNQLQPDGTLELDPKGLPIPTYDQMTISEMAKVFTGWQFNNPAPTKNNFRAGGGVSDDYMKPMTLNPNFHEDAAKTIIGNIAVPANQGGVKDLADTLDALFKHANTAPFISRRLIERLVTSNPSAGYIGRVAQIFANNGSGVRGDLAAVVKAILLDPEARTAETAQAPAFGKLKEPLLRVTALLRAFNASAENGRFAIANPEGALAQAALRSPTVFNFFDPSYIVPGALAAAKLYAPEFQILTDTTAISVPNNLYSYIFNTRGPTTIGLDLTGLPPTTPANGLVDYLNLVFCAGSMPQTQRDRIATALTAMPKTATDLDKDRAAIYLTVSTQAAAIQK